MTLIKRYPTTNERANYFKRQKVYRVREKCDDALIEILILSKPAFLRWVKVSADNSFYLSVFILPNYLTSQKLYFTFENAIETFESLVSL